MARWKLGESEIEDLLASGDLHKLTGDAANGERLLEKAAVTLETARSAIIERIATAIQAELSAATRACASSRRSGEGLVPPAACRRLRPPPGLWPPT